jgi:spore coat protein U-like protein
MLRGISSGTAAGRLSKTGAVSVNVTGAKATTGLVAGTSGSFSPGKRYLANSSRVWKNFGVGQPASLMGAS